MRIAPAAGPRATINVIKVTSVSPPSKPANIKKKSNASRTRSSKTEYIDEAVALSTPMRALLWCTIMFVVLANAALLAIFAYEYMQNETNDSLLWLFRLYFLFSNGNAFLMAYSKRVATGYAVLCAVFLLVAVRLVWTSVTKRQLRFGSRTLSRARSLSSPRLNTMLKRPKSALFRVLYWYSQWQRAFGVRGPYFDLRLLAEEVFEIGGQTAAAYSSSHSISNVPLNVIYAVVIFLNSIGAFVFRRVFKTSLIKQRLACLMLDLVLDFTWGTLLPIWMYLPIIHVYLDRANVIDYLTTFSNSTREIERVLILSWKNYALSVVPFCNSLVNLLELQSVLREMSEKAGPIAPIKGSSDSITYVQMRYPVGRREHGPFVKFAHIALPLYGIGVLVMALAANGIFGAAPQQADMVCMHRVYPWFATKEACLGRQINCTTMGIEGNKVDMETMLSSFDQGSLADLHLYGCSALEMPSKIQEFSNLMSIVIKQSTLVKWDESAFLDGEIFHELRTVQLWDVVVMEDPIGLTGVEPISKTVEWIHLENVDGARLLALAGDHWRGLLYFDCMGCGLTSIPEALYHMPLLTMSSFAFNDFTSIPEDWIPRSKLKFQMIWFDVNLQLTELPDSLWRQAATCGIFSMSYTNLSVVPEWVPDIAGPDFLLTAAETPVCAEGAQITPRVKKLLSCTGY